MAGGAWDYTAGNLSNSVATAYNQSAGFTTLPTTPYVDIWQTGGAGMFGSDTTINKPAWSNGTAERQWNSAICTWETCGGQATYETLDTQTASNTDASTYAINMAWGGDRSAFVYSGSRWSGRGGRWDSSSGAGVFAFDGDTGNANDFNSFRVALRVTPSP